MGNNALKEKGKITREEARSSIKQQQQQQQQ